MRKLRTAMQVVFLLAAVVSLTAMAAGADVGKVRK